MQIRGVASFVASLTRKKPEKGGRGRKVNFSKNVDLYEENREIR